ncbi:prostate and testis expressed protein 13-like [Lepus europaeus]|uniref:prostate and testis expressed protein 13-like n=1 Tax=Lepus europaeus TaxID=9983 RepID=UPI002B49F4F9|nr:prostate and testis expressed protein 13-like [Lepus europaeus]
MGKFPLMLLLLGFFPLVLVQGQATLCMVCSIFVGNTCYEGQGNCTVEQGRGCRTRDIYVFNVRDGFSYNHTQLDCATPCRAWKLIKGDLKVSSFCCQGRKFCNRLQGRSVAKKHY